MNQNNILPSVAWRELHGVPLCPPQTFMEWSRKKDSGQAGMTSPYAIPFFCHSRKRSAPGILLQIANALTEQFIVQR
jgi:hypothetical protein